MITYKQVSLSSPLITLLSFLQLTRDWVGCWVPPQKRESLGTIAECFTGHVLFLSQLSSQREHTALISIGDKCSVVAEMGNRLATINMGENWGRLCACAPLGEGELGPHVTLSPGPRHTSLPSGSLIHPVVWPQDMAKNWGNRVKKPLNFNSLSKSQLFTHRRNYYTVIKLKSRMEEHTSGSSTHAIFGIWYDSDWQRGGWVQKPQNSKLVKFAFLEFFTKRRNLFPLPLFPLSFLPVAISSLSLLRPLLSSPPLPSSPLLIPP